MAGASTEQEYKRRIMYLQAHQPSKSIKERRVSSLVWIKSYFVRKVLRKGIGWF